MPRSVELAGGAFPLYVHKKCRRAGIVPMALYRIVVDPDETWSCESYLRGTDLMVLLERGHLTIGTELVYEEQRVRVVEVTRLVKLNGREEKIVREYKLREVKCGKV